MEICKAPTLQLKALKKYSGLKLHIVWPCSLAEVDGRARCSTRKQNWQLATQRQLKHSLERSVSPSGPGSLFWGESDGQKAV